MSQQLSEDDSHFELFVLRRFIGLKVNFKVDLKLI